MAKAGKEDKPKRQRPKMSIFELETGVKKKLKYIAFTDEKTQAQIVNDALLDYFAKWEKKNGPVPERYSDD